MPTRNEIASGREWRMPDTTRGMSSRRVAWLIAWALAGCAGEPGPLGEHAEAMVVGPFLRPQTPTRPRTDGNHEVAVDLAALADRAVIELPSGRPVTLVRRREETHADGGRSWIGGVEGVDDSLVALVIRHDRVTGRLFMGAAQYELRPGRDGAHVLAEVDADQLPESGEALQPPSSGASGSSPGAGPQAPADDDGSLIDLLVLYTDDTEAASGDIVSEIQNIVDVTNEILANSEALPRVRLVHSARVDYVETADTGTDLQRLRAVGDGYLDLAHPLRDEHCADAVQLLFETVGDNCGRAYLMNPESASFSTSAFSVVGRSCASQYSPAHELGHNMGAGHDRYVDANCGIDNGSPPYSCGFVEPDEWRTVMGYRDECDDAGVSCPRIRHFSNPEVFYGGFATGVVQGQPDAADNAQTLSETADTVANFRQGADDDADGVKACRDCDDLDPDSHPGAPEICDDVDNDCDGATDEGTNGCGGVCVLANPPGTSCDGPDSDLCPDETYECAGANATQCSMGSDDGESCDGVDNDCDGATDEGTNGCGGVCPLGGLLGAPCDGADADFCPDDTVQCAGANAVSCTTGASNGDLCDGLDNDCDGVADNDESNGCGGSCALGATPGEACDGVDADACQDDTVACTGLNSVECSGGADNGDPCDGLDGDCDGAVDNDGSNACGGSCPLDVAPGAACDGADADRCVDDQAACFGLNATACSGGTDDADICDDVDNDCDGVVDNGGINACGGSCPLSHAPGTPCDGDDADDCDGSYECDGANATRCAAGADACELSGAPPDASSSDAGCGCAVGTKSGSGRGWLVGLLLAAIVAVRRRPSVSSG